MLVELLGAWVPVEEAPSAEAPPEEPPRRRRLRRGASVEPDAEASGVEEAVSLPPASAAPAGALPDPLLVRLRGPPRRPVPGLVS
ncbi:MAG: hypothetical protein ACXVXJ_04960, partial [Mycobacteriaceae bacterium]